MKLHKEMKTTKWSDCSIEVFKGNLESQIQRRNGLTEDWATVDRQSFGSTIWRIHDFGTHHWADEDYGTFYTEDVYLILSVRGYEDVQSSVIKFRYDIHVWAGRQSSKEDYESAIFKITELDERLNNLAVLHREVEGMESGLFKSYFNPVAILQGNSLDKLRGNATCRKPRAARLMRFYKPDPFLNNICVKEVQANTSFLDNSLVHVLDVGHTVYQYNGSLCKQEDAVKAMRFIQTQKANRGGRVCVEMLNEIDDEDTPNMKAFFTYLSRGSCAQRAESIGNSVVPTFPSLLKNSTNTRHTLFKISLKKGKQYFAKVKEGPVQIKELEKLGAAVYDTGLSCFIWIGRKIKNAERYSALEYIHDYLRSTGHPLASVTVLRDGQTSPAFYQALALAY